MPKGYTQTQENVPNPHPISGYENCETRWTEGETNYAWKDGNLYEKPAPTTPTTEWVQNLEKLQGEK